MIQPPVPISTTRPGLREICLLMIGAGFASLMFNLPNAAVACGAVALALWAVAMARGPRPSWRVTMSVGAGLVLMYMWWPAEGNAAAAIALMWLGVALVLTSLAWARVMRRRSDQVKPESIV